MGLGYDTLREINPRIIFASISGKDVQCKQQFPTLIIGTGYGPDGPYAHRAGYDMITGAGSVLTL